jgi:hypothetical protein
MIKRTTFNSRDTSAYHPLTGHVIAITVNSVKKDLEDHPIDGNFDKGGFLKYPQVFDLYSLI